MPTSARFLDRLLPRHEAGHLELFWDVREERVGLFKKAERYDEASISDLSLEGARVAVARDTTHEVGDHVTVRFRGLDGTAKVRHIHRTDDGVTQYGVQFLPEPEFRHAIELAVGELRGDNAELRAAWERAD